MKLAVDTNVLVRYLTWDDETQARAARDHIESADAIAVSTVVLCETVWVLKRAYRYSGAEIAETLAGVIHSRNVETDQPAAGAGLRMLARGGDFADGVIEHEAIRAGCDRLATFDETFEKLLMPSLSRSRR
ncbi:MAG TPA: type II toxin-antitoxin system VapC family toxin [Rhizomicrobium sp.]|jgi:predicted nucleic-acid-binding protein|nr:type II toxin-antitoxin system VapC family toxin [Rhizomicrobium sp.]